jgi:type IV fimbrial biogenesis protein FimT
MKTRSQGTTLLELMTALAVLGVMFAIAVPSFRQFTADSRTTAFTNDLVTALNLARSEALHRSSNVVTCASSNQTSCTGSATWASGFIVFTDLNANNALNVGTDTILRVWQPATTGIAVTAANSSGTPVSRIAYNSLGMGALAGGTAWVRFSFIPTGCTGNRAGQTDVLMSGTIQTRKVACP